MYCQRLDSMHVTTTSISEAYERLASLLTRCPQTIEILPGDGSTQDPYHIGSDPSYSPFLFVEDNLGVPQKILYKIYLYAVGVFKFARTTRTQTLTVRRNCDRDHDLDTSLVHVLIASSSLLLLANPSHQTALNTRKSLVRMHLIDPHDELRFVASLLSSQHCAKHAELWYHRRWLLSSADTSQLSDTMNIDSHSRLQSVSPEALQRELGLVSRACELYPRNYFAWTHRLICIRNLLLDHLSGTDAVDFVSVLRDEIIRIKRWIDSHVSDYSAVHYVLALSQTALQSEASSLMEITVENNLPDHAVSLVKEYPSHEALWMYVRSALSIFDLWKARKTQEFVDCVVHPLAQSRGLTAGTEADSIVASKLAKQFLDKREAVMSIKGQLSRIS